MNLRRAFVLLVMITCCLVFIIVQLMLIQLFHVSRYTLRSVDLTAASVYQRERGIVLHDGRGHFLDRYGKPLTGYTIQALAIEPMLARKWAARHEKDAQRLLHTMGMSADEWTSILDRKDAIVLWEREGSPVALTMSQTEAASAYTGHGMKVVPYQRRYRSPYYASHLLGYLSQHPERMQQLYEQEISQGKMGLDRQLGASGLELTYEREMRSRGVVSLSVLTDALGRPLRPASSRIRNTNHRLFPLYAVTTIDLELQARVEQLLDRYAIQQASVVLLEPRTADVLVMANRPNYDPYHPEPSERTWVNRAVKEQVPGSIFKLVIAAAALEYGVVRPHESFTCEGEYGKYGFSCWKRDGHGQLSFREAFAQSCNITFAQVARRLTPEQIERIGHALGVGRKIGWEEAIRGGGTFRQLDHEENGRIFTADGQDEGVMIQSAIGQRDVRLTPLQAANMVVSLLNGGRLTAPRVVREVRYRDGGMKRSYAVQRHRSRISPSTATQLLSMMQETVRSGTASTLADHPWKLAGKTGTAELGQKGQRVNRWFVGYGPTDRPQFAATVVVYDVEVGDRGEHIAQQLFIDIADIVREVYEVRENGQVDRIRLHR